MKGEQIKRILTDNFNAWGFTQEFFDLSADAILALPLDVPSDEEIENYLWEEIHVPLSEHDRLNNTLPYKIYKETFLWMRWMRDEIIKRNK